MSLTRAGVRAAVREVLADTGAYPDATLNAWIAEAVRDYSLVFPYRASDEVGGESFSAARTYSLGGYANPHGLNVFRVEYPAYREPPAFLTRLGESHPAFFGGDCFDVRPGSPPLLVLGRLPAASEVVVIHIETSHAAPDDDITPLTLPDQHLEALVLFVTWRGHLEALMVEEQSPDHASDVISRLSVNAERAEQAYRRKLEAYRAALVTGGFAGPWQADRFDRIY